MAVARGGTGKTDKAIDRTANRLHDTDSKSITSHHYQTAISQQASKAVPVEYLYLFSAFHTSNLDVRSFQSEYCSIVRRSQHLSQSSIDELDLSITRLVCCFAHSLVRSRGPYYAGTKAKAEELGACFLKDRLLSYPYYWKRCVGSSGYALVDSGPVTSHILSVRGSRKGFIIWRSWSILILRRKLN